MEFLNNESIEKIKALELSNFIDDLEQSMLLEEDGAYYKKLGKEAIFNPNKKEGGALSEFQKFEREIDKKVRELNLSPMCENLLNKIKAKKMEMIKNNLSSHETLQIQSWASQTIEEAIELSIKKAVFHRENEEEISSIIQNGKMAIMLKGEFLGYDLNSLKIELEQYENELISSVLNSYGKEGNLKIIDFYKKYKKILSKENQEKYEKIIEEIKRDYGAKELSNRLFDLYPDNKKEAFCTLKKERGDDCAKNLLEGKFSSKEKNDEENQNTLLMTMFQEISKAKRNGGAINYDLIPYELNDENKKGARAYIDKIMRGDEIETKNSDFLFLYEKYEKNPLGFPKFNFVKYKMNLSDYDFTLFLRLADEAMKITKSEAEDSINLINDVIADFDDDKKVKFIRYFLDDLYVASSEKRLKFEDKKEIIKRRATELIGEKKGIFEEIKTRIKRAK